LEVSQTVDRAKNEWLYCLEVVTLGPKLLDAKEYLNCSYYQKRIDHEFCILLE
jgi:hypothetical protein